MSKDREWIRSKDYGYPETNWKVIAAVQVEIMKAWTKTLAMKWKIGNKRGEHFVGGTSSCWPIG